jgi:hypothetical protein
VLHFYVERLYPDIVLHEIRSGEQGPGPMKMAAAFREGRDEAWRTVSPLIDDIGAAAPMERRRLLHERVTAGSGTLFAHLRLLATTQVLNGLLRNTCGAVMSAPFWLFPAQGLEMLVFPRRREAIGECLAHFILPEAGRVEINVFGLEKGIGWRLYCENPSFPSAEQLFPAEWTCLGLHEMPEFMASGLLPRFLPSAGSSMGFERRV